jgi:hypothetical protein
MEFKPFPGMNLYYHKLEAVDATNKHFIMVFDLVKNIDRLSCLSEHGHAESHILTDRQEYTNCIRSSMSSLYEVTIII